MSAGRSQPSSPWTTTGCRRDTRPSVTALTTSEDALATVTASSSGRTSSSGATSLEVTRNSSMAGPELEGCRTCFTRSTPRERANAIETRFDVVVSDACSSRS